MHKSDLNSINYQLFSKSSSKTSSNNEFFLENMQIQRAMLISVQRSKSAICHRRRNRSNLVELFAILARGMLARTADCPCVGDLKVLTSTMNIQIPLRYECIG